MSCFFCIFFPYFQIICSYCCFFSVSYAAVTTFSGTWRFVIFTVAPHAAAVTATPSSPHDNTVSAQLLVTSAVGVYITRIVYLFLYVDPGVTLWSEFCFHITFSFLDVETLVFFLLLCFVSVFHQIRRQWSILFVSMIYFAFVSRAFSALAAVWAFWVWYIWGYLCSLLITDW